MTEDTTQAPTDAAPAASPAPPTDAVAAAAPAAAAAPTAPPAAASAQAPEADPAAVHKAARHARHIAGVKARHEQIVADGRPLAELLPVRDDIERYVKELTPAARVSPEHAERLEQHQAQLAYLNEVLK